MTDPLEREALLVQAKLTMVRYRNALQAIRDQASRAEQHDIKHIASVALRDRSR